MRAPVQSDGCVGQEAQGVDMIGEWNVCCVRCQTINVGSAWACAICERTLHPEMCSTCHGRGVLRLNGDPCPLGDVGWCKACEVCSGSGGRPVMDAMPTVVLKGEWTVDPSEPMTELVIT